MGIEGKMAREGGVCRACGSPRPRHRAQRGDMCGRGLCVPQRRALSCLCSAVKHRLRTLARAHARTHGRTRTDGRAQARTQAQTQDLCEADGGRLGEGLAHLLRDVGRGREHLPRAHRRGGGGGGGEGRGERGAFQRWLSVWSIVPSVSLSSPTFLLYHPFRPPSQGVYNAKIHQPSAAPIHLPCAAPAILRTAFVTV